MKITFEGNLLDVKSEMIIFLEKLNPQSGKQPADLSDVEQAEQLNSEPTKNKAESKAPATEEVKTEAKPKSATKKVDKKDVIAISKKALAKEGGREKVLEIYKENGEGGTGKLSDVPQENYGAVIKALEAVVNG